MSIDCIYRRYLSAKARSPRELLVLSSTGEKKITPVQINKMTMGQLAGIFSIMKVQNHADKTIGQTLKRLNPDRVAVVHHKCKTIMERRLRTNVGRHMWTIVAALNEFD